LTTISLGPWRRDRAPGGLRPRSAPRTCTAPRPAMPSARRGWTVNPTARRARRARSTMEEVKPSMVSHPSAELVEGLAAARATAWRRL